MSRDGRLRLAELHPFGVPLNQIDLNDPAHFDKVISVADEVGNHYLFWHVAGGVCQVALHGKYLGEACLYGPLQLRRRIVFKLADKPEWQTMSVVGMTTFSLEEEQQAA